MKSKTKAFVSSLDETREVIRNEEVNQINDKLNAVEEKKRKLEIHCKELERI
jgi:hypothetical protein